MSNENIKIEDNFLAPRCFEALQQAMMGPGFPWYYNDSIDSGEDIDKFQFVHGFYIESAPISDNIQVMNPILGVLKPTALYRIKANLLTRTLNIIENKFHADIGRLSEENQKHWTTSIFYVNTNNGYTKFKDGTKIESVANRLLTFPSNLEHTGTSCTDEMVRVVINFNYFQ
jgi:hypothetical protein